MSMLKTNGLCVARESNIVFHVGRDCLKQCLFRGRVLVANQLAASKLLHVLATFSQPERLIDELQEKTY